MDSLGAEEKWSHLWNFMDTLGLWNQPYPKFCQQPCVFTSSEEGYRGVTDKRRSG